MTTKNGLLPWLPQEDPATTKKVIHNDDTVTAWTGVQRKYFRLMARLSTCQ